MDREHLRRQLHALAETDDTWFGVRPSDDANLFIVEDDRGGSADLVLATHWVEILAVRPAARAAQALLDLSAGRASLLRVQIPEAASPSIEFCGRVYLDGLSLQSLFVAVRDVLAVAGPLEKLTEAPDLAEAEAEEQPSTMEVVLEETAAFDGAETAVLPDAATFAAELADDAPVDEGSVVDVPDAPDIRTIADAGEIAETPVPEAVRPVIAATVVEEAAVTELAAAEPATPAPSAPEPGPSEEKPQDRLVSQTIIMPRMNRVTSTPAPVAEESTPAAPASPAAAASTPTAAVSTPTAEAGAAAKASHACPACSADVEEGERFCIACGAPQQAAAQEPAPASPWVRPAPATTTATDCERCGFHNPPNNRFCQGCGAPLAA